MRALIKFLGINLTQIAPVLFGVRSGSLVQNDCIQQLDGECTEVTGTTIDWRLTTLLQSLRCHSEALENLDVSTLLSRLYYAS